MSAHNGTGPARPRRVLIYGDCALPTGFGRINAAVAKHLLARGYEVMAACPQYDGLLPHGQPLWIASLQGKDMGQGPFGWARVVGQIAAAWNPDVVISTQDFPYHIALRQGSGIDWSVTGHLVITPVDGVPIDSDWLSVVPDFDALMTISQFGVTAFKDAGHRAVLCPPGVDTGEFHRLPDEARAELRARLDIPADAFVVGVMAMNQGRKDFPSMVQAFADAFRDVPEAFLYLDCEKDNPAGGWRIIDQLARHVGLDESRCRFRANAVQKGIVQLNDRYNLLDVHMVIAHREGYGLPHGEAMATGIPSIAIDYCSGREIIGDNERGWLVPAVPHKLGTWGGARDCDPDMDALTAALREAYENPAERQARGARGLTWAQARTWEKAGEAVESVLAGIFERRGADIAKKDMPQGAPILTPPSATAPLIPQIVLDAKAVASDIVSAFGMPSYEPGTDGFQRQLSTMIEQAIAAGIAIPGPAFAPMPQQVSIGSANMPASDVLYKAIERAASKRDQDFSDILRGADERPDPQREKGDGNELG